MRENSEVSKYYKNIKTLLPINGKAEKQYLTGFKNNLSEFSQENPNASYQEIIDEFGEPKDIIISYLDNCDEDYIFKKLNTRNIVFKLSKIITIIAICLSLWFCFLWYRGYEEANKQNIDSFDSYIAEE